MQPQDPTENPTIEGQYTPKGPKDVSEDERRFSDMITKWRAGGKAFYDEAQDLLDLYARLQAPDSSDMGDATVISTLMFQFIDKVVSTVLPVKPQGDVKSHRKALANKAKARALLATRDIENDPHFEDKCERVTILAAILREAFFEVTWDVIRQCAVVEGYSPLEITWDTQARSFEESEWVCKSTKLTMAQFRARVKGKTQPLGAVPVARIYRNTAWNDAVSQKKRGGAGDGYAANHHQESDTATSYEVQSLQNTVDVVYVYEVYDFVNRQVLHFLADVPEALYIADLPYRYMPRGNHFVRLESHDAVRHNRGMSDAMLIRGFVEDLELYNTAEKHTSLTHGLPAKFYNKAAVNNPEALESKIQKKVPGSWIPLDLKPNFSIDNFVRPEPLQSTTVDFASAKATAERNVHNTLSMNQLDGAQTATRDAIQDEAQAKNVARRKRKVAKALSSVCKRIVALHRQYMPKDKVLFVFDEASGEEVQATHEDMGFLSLEYVDENGNVIKTEEVDGVKKVPENAAGVRDPEDEIFVYGITEGEAETGNAQKRRYLASAFPVLESGIAAGVLDPHSIFGGAAEAYGFGDGVIPRQDYEKRQREAAQAQAQAQQPEDTSTGGAPGDAAAQEPVPGPETNMLDGSQNGGEVQVAGGGQFEPTMQGGPT